MFAKSLSINGIKEIIRVHEFDDKAKFRSGGIRLYYESYTPTLEGLKDGILLEAGSDIKAFIGTPEYLALKAARIKGADNQIPLREHPALLLSDPEIRESFQNRYESTSKLYYNGQPDFKDILARIQLHLDRL